MCRGEWPQSRRNPCCLQLPDVYVRPDPLIYAQYYLMSQGLAVTWDNPDIVLFDNGVAVSSQSLKPDHLYEVRVRVWNGSYSAPAVGVEVTLSYLTFGIATTSTAVGTTSINLGAKGSAQHPAFAIFHWRTPAERGHYCLQAQLYWHDDANPDNNLGQENVMVGELASPAHFVFTVRNDASVERRFVFDADTYQLTPPPPCDDAYRRRFGDGTQFATRIAESRARWEWARGAMSYGSFPVPDDWSVAMPAELSLGAGEQHAIEVTIEPRDPDFRGSAAFNIHGFVLGPDDTRRLVGGVTLTVTR